MYKKKNLQFKKNARYCKLQFAWLAAFNTLQSLTQLFRSYERTTIIQYTTVALCNATHIRNE